MLVGKFEFCVLKVGCWFQMSSRKRKHSAKKEDGEEENKINDVGSNNSDQDAKDITGNEGTDNKEQTDNGGEAQDASVSGPSTTDSGEGGEQVTDGYFAGEEDKPEKKKFVCIPICYIHLESVDIFKTEVFETITNIITNQLSLNTK